MSEEVRRHVVVRGRVQGVSYRSFAQRMARHIGVRGWVRNRPDGSVEALGAGPNEQVERWVAVLRHGPPFALVADLEETVVGTDEPLPEEFEIRW